jgi:hypothetical protein
MNRKLQVESTARSDGDGGRFLCDSRLRIYPPSLPAVGRGDWGAQRSNRQADPRALARSFSLAFAESALFDVETGRDLIFLTNHLEIPAVVVAGIYRLRWQIELFFRWIKGHLRIKHFFGTRPNAVKTQIWIAVTTYLLVAIIHKQLGLPGNLHRTLQLLSVHPFEKMPLHELFTETEFNAPPTDNPNQLLLCGL